MKSVDEISRGIEELESNEDLARVTGEAIQKTAKIGRKAWEALFEMLDSDEQSVEEIELQFGSWIDKRAQDAADADTEESESDD